MENNFIIYTMTDDFYTSLSNITYNKILDTIDILNRFDKETFNKLFTNKNIISDLDIKLVEEKSKIDKWNKKLNELLYFYYPNLKEYEILKNEEGIITGEVKICFN